jgi:hypothetical protein
MKERRWSGLKVLFVVLAIGALTTAVRADQITDVLASPSVWYGPSWGYWYNKAVDGSGISGSPPVHSEGNGDWLSAQNAIDGASLIVDLKKNYQLDSADTLRVWNHNMSGKTDRCMKNARFFVSADSTTWTEVAGAQIRQKDGTAIAAFRQAPGADSYGDYDTVDLGPGITARYVKIMTDGGQNSGNYGDNAYVGLAEVQVFGTLVSNPHDVLTDQITGVTATASTEWGGREAEHLTDNSGISGLTHDCPGSA